jgi:hypothetical protein
VEGDQVPERVRMRRIPNVTKDTLTDFVLDNVARGSEVRTDGWQGYFDIGRYRFSHVVTNVSASGDPAHVALPHVHLVSSLLQRWILGTHQGAISHAQLDSYLDEFTFRFNRRRGRHRGLLFYRLLEGALAAGPHPDATLIARRQAALDLLPAIQPNRWSEVDSQSVPKHSSRGSARGRPFHAIAEVAAGPSDVRSRRSTSRVRCGALRLRFDSLTELVGDCGPGAFDDFANERVDDDAHDSAGELRRVLFEPSQDPPHRPRVWLLVDKRVLELTGLG